VKTLVLDQGNSTLFAGIFRGEKLMRSARIAGNPASHLVKLARGKVDRVALCSVVPAQTETLLNLVRKHFGLETRVLTSTADHGLKLAYHRPAELGVDRVANGLGAQKLYPRNNVIVVDWGSATTLTLLARDGTLLGGTIMPGLEMSAAVLHQRTARLPEVALKAPLGVVGRDTESAILSGIVHGHVGAIRELVAQTRAEAFGRSPVVVLGTGGLVTQIKCQSLFTAVETGLILHGLQAFASENPAHA